CKRRHVGFPTDPSPTRQDRKQLDKTKIDWFRLPLLPNPTILQHDDAKVTLQGAWPATGSSSSASTSGPCRLAKVFRDGEALFA
ncbi:hypothetical protein ACVSQB_42910, partial [Bradyrhizobium elkanii]